MPTARGDYIREYPWLGFQGRWGEKQAGVFNGPTGPNDKTQWTEPFTWAAESWRDTSFAVPASGNIGTNATDIFCTSVAGGSELLRRIKASPGISILVIGGLGVLLLWGLSRTRWDPSAPLPVARPRAWGQMLTASWRMFASHPRVFLGIGLLFVPIGILIALLQYLLFHLTSLEALVDEAGRRNSFVATLAFGVGLVFTLLGFALVQAATSRAVVEIDAGRAGDPGLGLSLRPAGAEGAPRRAGRRGRRGAGAEPRRGADPGGRLPGGPLVAPGDRGGHRGGPGPRHPATQRRDGATELVARGQHHPGGEPRAAARVRRSAS